MRYAAIRTLAFTAILAAWPVYGAEPEAPLPPPPPTSPLAKSGMPDALFQAITSDSQRPLVMTRGSDIPPYIAMLLSRFATSFADADRPYGGPKPPVGEEGLPSDRLVWATRIDDYFILNWEANDEYAGSNAHAFRMQPNGKARFIWSARLGRLANAPEGQMNPYRSLAAFTDALENGEITGSNGRCFNLMFVTPTAVNVLLRRRTGPPVADLAALPAPVQETVRFSQGDKIKWAVPVGDHYVVDSPKDSGEVIALIRNPPSTPNRAVWKGPTPAFARFEEFQEALRNSMSPESEAEIRAGRCSAPTRAAQARPQK